MNYIFIIYTLNIKLYCSIATKQCQLFQFYCDTHSFVSNYLLLLFLVQMTARNRVNVSVIDVCAKAIGLQKTAVYMHVQMVAVRTKDVVYARKSIADVLM